MQTTTNVRPNRHYIHLAISRGGNLKWLRCRCRDGKRISTSVCAASVHFASFDGQVGRPPSALGDEHHGRPILCDRCGEKFLI